MKKTIQAGSHVSPAVNPVNHGLRMAIALLLAFIPALSQEASRQLPKENAPTILFVCEHGAAKSVIAAAHFDRLAKEAGLKYRAVFRGTNPDPALAAAAVKGLAEDEIDTKDWKPKLVTKMDMESASRIVTLGCVLPEKESVANKVIEWNDVPSVSQNYRAAKEHILEKMRELVEELARQPRR